MMLGFGSYMWDKRCPTRKRCIPPIYGNFGPTYIKVPTNSPRKPRKDQAEARLSAAPRQPSWRAGIPRGNDVCIKLGSRRNNKAVAPLKIRSTPIHPSHHHQRQSLNEIFTKANCVGNPSPSLPQYMSLPTLLAAAEYNGMDSCKKKQFYNVMWDPKIARGPTLVQFEEAQRAKWQHQVDSQRAILVREQIRRRRRKMKEERYLDAKSNPMRRIVYPTVTIRKEPLSFSSFAPFLTEECELVEKTNAEQVTDDVAPPGQNKNSLHSFSRGIPVGVQTDMEPYQREETVNWITAKMLEKIPEQAVLELVEQAELDSVKAEQQRYELVFLYRKWQEMKENQWNEYLRAWNEIRMREIMDQDAHLRDQQERISVIGFCKNAISCCFQKSLDDMKRDRFVNELGVPYEELEELIANLDYQDEIEEKYVRKQMLSRKVVDSALLNAIISRFAHHMADEYGRPHGNWLSKRGQRFTVDHDVDLQNYLENRWMHRRAETTESLHALYSENSLFDIFDLYKDFNTAVAKGKATKIVAPEIGVMKNLILKHRLGPSTGKNPRQVTDNKHHDSPGSGGGGGGKDIHGHGKNPNNDDDDDEDDVAMLYKRKTSWSKLDRDDEHHHRQHQQEQQQGSQGNVERGSRSANPVANAKRVSIGSRSIMGIHGGVSSFSRSSIQFSSEVDSDNWIQPNGESEKRSEKLPSLKPKSGTTKPQTKTSNVKF